MNTPSLKIKQAKEYLSDLAATPHQDAYTQINDAGDATTVIQYVVSLDADLSGKPNFKVTRVTIEEYLYS